jgi:PAS domain S-box-containing protein
MRVNLPVTNEERIVGETDSIVSKTNLRGVITYVNRTFCEISGFSEEELIGQAHNIVRHPDMPPEAYQDLWDTLKSGKPWKGIVKNRCKDGAFYWVEANANPVFENGKIVGYMSLRTRPSRQQIEFAEQIYKKIREGHGGITVKQGRILRAGITGFYDRLRNISISMRMIMIFSMLIVLALGLGIAGLIGMYRTNHSLKTVYEDRLIPMERISRIDRLILHNRLLLTSSLVSSNPVDVQENIAKLESNIDEITGIWESYMTTYLTEEEKVLAEKFAEDRGKFVSEGLRPAIEALRNGNFNAAGEIITQRLPTFYRPVGDNTNALIRLQADVARQEYNQAVTRFNTTSAVSAAAIIILGTLAAVLAFLLIRSIVRPLRKVEDIAMAVSSGDLTSDIQVTSDDEIGRVLQCIKNINGNIRGIVNDIRLASAVVTQAANEVSMGNANLSQRTQEQASSLEEMASSMEEMTGTVNQNADNSQEASKLATAAQERAENGGQVVNKAVEAMEKINDASKKIAEIIGVIDEIAFQTNLLALNAAVEAARAGEQGRGFAVVASEVRNLAGRSATAAKEIKALIRNSVDKVEEGTKLVNESGKMLGEIVASVKKVSHVMAEIAAASQEQSAGINQVNKAVMQMDDMTQQNAALVEQAAAASESMGSQGEKLDELMQFFRLNSTDTIKKVTTRRRTTSGISSPAKATLLTKGKSMELEVQDSWEEF